MLQASRGFSKTVSPNWDSRAALQALADRAAAPFAPLCLMRSVMEREGVAFIVSRTPEPELPLLAPGRQMSAERPGPWK